MNRTPEQTMLYWLATAAQEARGEVSREDLADYIGVSAAALRNFELAHTWPQANRIDRVLAGYAAVAGMEDGRGLWERAIELWRADAPIPEGEVPTSNDGHRKRHQADLRLGERWGIAELVIT